MQKVRWLILFLLFCLPIAFFPYTYLAFELPKILILYLVSVLIIYFLSISGYRLHKPTKIQGLYIIFLLWIIFTSIIGQSFEQSFWGSYFRMQGIITWICYSALFFISGMLFSDNHFKLQAAAVVLITSAFIACLALTQFVALWFFGDTSQLLYANRVISTFGQPNFLGAYLVLSLPFSWFMLKHIQKKWKHLIGFLIIVIILGIFSTLSRSAYLGLVLLAIVWGFYHYRLLIIGIIFSIALFVFLGNLFPSLVNHEWFRFKVDTLAEWTPENRLLIGQKSLKLIAQKPFTGYGLENFSSSFSSVTTPDDLGLKDLVVDSSHNLFLDLAAALGLIGLGIFLAILMLTIKSGLNKQEDFTKTCLCVVVSFLVIHQFSPVSVVPMVFFWISMGVLCNGTSGVIEKSSEERIVTFPQAKSKIDRNDILKHGIGISIIIVTIYFIVQTIRADILFRESSFYEVVNIHKSITLDNKAIHIAPWINFYKVRKDFLIKQLGY